MKPIKTLGGILLLALVALFAAPDVQAQPYKTTILDAGVEDIITASANSNYTANVITVPRARTVTLQPRFQLTGAGTAPVTLTVQGSVDGANWYNLAPIHVVSAGTSFVTTNGTYDLGGALFIQVPAITNGNAGAVVTNLSLVAGAKDGL